MEGVAEAAVLDEIPGAIAIHARNRLPRDVVDQLLSLLAHEPLVLLCDLTGVAPVGATMGEAFDPVGYYCGHWPGTVVVLYSPDERVRAHLSQARLGDQVLICNSWLRGINTAITMLSEVRRAQVYLPPAPSASGDARGFVTRVLEQWDLVPLVEPAALMTGELVTNSFEYARTVLGVSVSHTKQHLRVAVSDRGGRRHEPGPIPGDALNGRCLRIVREHTRGWGVLPGRPGGKTVWVVLDDSAAMAEYS